MSIPPGFIRCERCGEFSGTTRAKYLNWEGSVHGEDPEKQISVSCLCCGIPCPKCGQMNIHRPGSNSYSETENSIGHWPAFTAMFACRECRKGDDRYRSVQDSLRRGEEWLAGNPPDPNEIVDVLVGDNEEGEGPFFQVVRRGRTRERISVPCGTDLEELLDNDPDFHDYDSFSTLLTEEGEDVFSLEWDSGGPGAGAGCETVYELADRFYYICEGADMYGPFATVDEVVEAAELWSVNDATTSISSSYHDTEEIVARLVTNDCLSIGHEIMIDWEPWVFAEPGVFVLNDDDPEEQPSHEQAKG